MRTLKDIIEAFPNYTCCRLIKISRPDVPGGLRTPDVLGVAKLPPVVGQSFKQVGEPLDKAADMRSIETSPITEVTPISGGFEFKTATGSVYQVKPEQLPIS
jgi:hypothetical protein